MSRKRKNRNRKKRTVQQQAGQRRAGEKKRRGDFAVKKEPVIAESKVASKIEKRPLNDLKKVEETVKNNEVAGVIDEDVETQLIDSRESSQNAKKDAENDQWSVEEIERNVKESEKNDQRSVKAEIIEIDVDATNGKRRGKSWIWWLVGVLAVLLVGSATWAVMSLGGDDSMVVDGNNADVEEPDGESKETPVEEEKPEEIPKGEEEPVEEQPKDDPVQKPVKELAPRPEAPVDDSQVTPGSKLVALTFDDGPSAATTPRLLDILQQKQVHATFFVLGNLAQRSPDIVRREKAEGHEVGSHTMYHNQLTKLSFADVRGEAAEMDRIFTEILGQVSPFTRPPYGAYNATVGQALGQPMILWSVDPRDWADRNASVVCNRVLSATVDGSIVLIHDIHATTVDAVPCIIDGLRARGFEFLTVSELAAVRDVPLVNGQAYFSF